MKRVTKLLLSCRTFRDSLVQPLRHNHHPQSRAIMKRVTASTEVQSDMSKKSLVPSKNDTFITYLDREMRDQLVNFLNKHSSKSDLYNKENYVLMLTKTSANPLESSSTEKLGPLICLEEMNQALLNADPILKMQVNVLNNMKKLLNIMKLTTKNAKLDEKILQIDQQIADVILLSKNNHRLTKQYNNLKQEEREKNFEADNKKAMANFKNIFQNSGKMFWRIFNRHKLLDTHIKTIYNKKMQALCSKNKLMDVNTSLMVVSSGHLLGKWSSTSIKSKVFLNDNVMFLNAMRTDFKDFMWGIHLLGRDGRIENTTTEICDKLNKTEKSKEELQQIILDASQSVIRLNKKFGENVKLLVKIEKLLRNFAKGTKFDNYQTFIISYFLKEKLTLIKNSFLNDCMTISLNKKYLRLFEKTALNETLYEEQKEIFVHDCKKMFSVVYGSSSGKSLRNIFTNSYFSSSSQRMVGDVLKSNSTPQPTLMKSCSDIEVKYSRRFLSACNGQRNELFFDAQFRENITKKNEETTINDLLPEVEKAAVVQKIDLNKVFAEKKCVDEKLPNKTTKIPKKDANHLSKKSDKQPSAMRDLKAPSSGEKKLVKKNKHTTTVKNASTQETGMKFVDKKKKKGEDNLIRKDKCVKTDVINSQEFEKIRIDEGTQSQLKSVSTDLNPINEKQIINQNAATEEDVKESQPSKSANETKMEVQKPPSRSVLINQKILEKIKANRERNFAQPHSWKELPEIAYQSKWKLEEPKKEVLKTKTQPKSAVPVPQLKTEFKFTFTKPVSAKKLQTVKDIKYPDANRLRKLEGKMDALPPKKVFKIFTCQTPCQTDENLEVNSDELQLEGYDGKLGNVNPSLDIAELMKALPDHLESRGQNIVLDTDRNGAPDQIKNIADNVRFATKRIRSTELFNANKAKDNVSRRSNRGNFDDEITQSIESMSGISQDMDCVSKSRSSAPSKQRPPKIVALKNSFSRKFSFDKIPLRHKESSVSLVKGNVFSFKHYIKSCKDNVDNSGHLKVFQSKYKKSGKWGVDLSLTGQTASNEQVRYKGSAHSFNLNRSKK